MLCHFLLFSFGPEAVRCQGNFSFVNLCQGLRFVQQRDVYSKESFGGALKRRNSCGKFRSWMQFQRNVWSGPMLNEPVLWSYVVLCCIMMLFMVLKFRSRLELKFNHFKFQCHILGIFQCFAILLLLNRYRVQLKRLTSQVPLIQFCFGGPMDILEIVNIL